MTVCARLFIDSCDQFQFGHTTRPNLLSNVTTDSATNFYTSIIQTKIVAKNFLKIITKMEDVQMTAKSQKEPLC